LSIDFSLLMATGGLVANYKYNNKVALFKALGVALSKAV
jgi:hypothetical protein